MSCLKHANCPQCQLAKGGKPDKLVHSRGNSSAWLAIVGEAPNALEVIKKRILHESAPTGQFIDQMLAACGIRTSEVYYASALLCNYPSGTKPSKRSVEACKSRLDYELRNLPNLRVIIACGKYALQSLLDKEKITQELYNVYWSERLHAYIIPSYHPAFVLREIASFEDVAWVFQTAKRLKSDNKSGALSPTPMVRYTAKSSEEAVEFLNKLAEINWPCKIAVDCESDDADWVRTPMLAVGFAFVDPGGIEPFPPFKAYTAVTIPWINESNPPEVASTWDFFVAPEMLDALERVSKNPNLHFCFHNGDFDVKLIAQNTGIFFRIDDDTMLLHHCLDERGGGDGIEGSSTSAKIGSHRLKIVAKKYLLIPDWEGDIKQFLKSKKTKYSNIPRKKLHEYLGYDVVYCLQLVDELKRVSKEDEPIGNPNYWHPLDAYHRVMIPAQNAITLDTFDGVNIDEKKRSKLSTQYRKNINDLYAKMIEYIRILENRTGPKPPRVTKFGKLTKDQPLEFNPNSNAHLKKLIYDTLKIQLTKDLKTDEKGKISKSAWPTGRSVLLKLRDKHPIIECLIQYKLLNKRYGTYVKPLVRHRDKRGHIHTDIMLAATGTSRTASKNPNLQNLTKDIKELYIPDAEF